MVVVTYKRISPSLNLPPIATGRNLDVSTQTLEAKGWRVRCWSLCESGSQPTNRPLYRGSLVNNLLRLFSPEFFKINVKLWQLRQTDTTIWWLPVPFAQSGGWDIPLEQVTASARWSLGSCGYGTCSRITANKRCWLSWPGKTRAMESVGIDKGSNGQLTSCSRYRMDVPQLDDTRFKYKRTEMTWEIETKQVYIGDDQLLPLLINVYRNPIYFEDYRFALTVTLTVSLSCSHYICCIERTGKT